VSTIRKKKDQLIDLVKQLGGVVNLEVKFDPSITHVVVPPETHTIKGLAALITEKWVVSPSWLEDSAKVKMFLPPDKYGIRGKPSPFEGKTFYINQTSFEKEIFHNALILLETLGKGKRVPFHDGADIIISNNIMKDVLNSNTPHVYFTWATLVEYVKNNHY